MLSSCGHALSQGNGSDFHPGYNWQATAPGYSTCMRAWRRLAPPMGPHLPRLTQASKKGWKKRGVLAGVPNCGRSQKQAAEEDWHGDVNPGLAAMLDCSGPHILGENHDHVALGCSLLPCDLGSRRDLAGRKGVKRLLLVGHE